MLADERNLFEQAVDTYGRDAQWAMIVEECGELIAELQRFKRGRGTLEDVVEEATDVRIMLDQLVVMTVRMGMGVEAWVLMREQKVARLAERLGKRERMTADGS